MNINELKDIKETWKLSIKFGDLFIPKKNTKKEVIKIINELIKYKKKECKK